MVHDRDPVAERLGLVHVVRGQHDGAAGVVERRAAGPRGCAGPAGRARRSARRGRPPRGRAPARRRSTAAAPGRRRASRRGCRPCRSRPTRSSHSSAPVAAGRRTATANVWICSRAVSRSKNAEACSCTPIRGSSRGLRGQGGSPSSRDGARVRPAQPLDHLQRRGLAGAVGAEDAEELALGRPSKADAVDRPELAVGLGEVDHLDGCSHGATTLTAACATPSAGPSPYGSAPPTRRAAARRPWRAPARRARTPRAPTARTR